MVENIDLVPHWKLQDLPPMLSRRFEFTTYAETRSFLDQVAKVAEESKLHPNLSFGKTYVSVTIDADGNAIGVEAVALAQKFDALVPEVE